METRAQEELCSERKQFWTPTKRWSLTVDSFERLTGREADYYDTRAKLVVEGDQLRSLANGKSSGVGYLELVSLADLRENGAGSRSSPTRLVRLTAFSLLSRRRGYCRTAVDTREGRTSLGFDRSRQGHSMDWAADQPDARRFRRWPRSESGTVTPSMLAV